MAKIIFSHNPKSFTLIYKLEGEKGAISVKTLYKTLKTGVFRMYYITISKIIQI